LIFITGYLLNYKGNFFDLYIVYWIEGGSLGLPFINVAPFFFVVTVI
jgi:hypothetical protein